MPNVASNTPPTVGPKIWLALLAPTSIDIAALIRSSPTTSPIIVRRTGLSVVQPMPFKKLATASCHTASSPAKASTARVSEVSPIDSDDEDQRGAPFEPLGDGADHRAEQRHRQHPQHGQRGDDEGRAGVLISEHGDRQHLEPAHREDHQADQPQAARNRARRSARRGGSAPRSAMLAA